MSDAQPTTNGVSGLYDHAGYWLSRLQAEVHGQLEKRLAAHGVTAAQWGVLIGLYQGASETVRGLASFLSVDGGAVTRLIDRLESKGLVERKVDKADRRSVILTLSETGRALIGPLVRAVDEHDAAMLGTLSTAERRAFLTALSRLLEAQGIETHGRPFENAVGLEPKKAKKTAPASDRTAAVAVAVTIEKKGKSGKKAKKAKKDKKAKKEKKKKGKKKGKKKKGKK